jgi:rhamnose utilization protein RhaD (predicted bifunctional aldolase and dehydrogenase)
VLWVKGSGAWLANANQENIFVPVDLSHLEQALSVPNFEIKPQVIAGQAEQKFRPSIETLLHALMPQKIVVHLHAVDALSHLVMLNYKAPLQERFIQYANAHEINSILVDYHKPGPELAEAIHQELQANLSANVVFMKNHGIVIGAESIDVIYRLLKSINAICTPQKSPFNQNHKATPQVSPTQEYIPFANTQAQALALDPNLYKRLQHDWVLFPDHAVFLGPKAFTYNSWLDFSESEKKNHNKPELIFIENIGVFVKPDLNQSKSAQLLCYYDVISRVSPTSQLDPLDEQSISALLNWDAEKQRLKISR